MTPSPRPLWIARIAGTQAELGHQHGALLAAAGGGDAAVAHYRDLPAHLLTGEVPAPLRPAAALAIRGVAEVLLARLEAARPPALVARSRAFMAALGHPPAWSRYLAVMDLFQNAVGVAAKLAVGRFGAPARGLALAAAQPACSTAIVWGGASADGALRHARNFDFPGIGVWDAAPAMVICHPTGGQRYAFITTRGGDTPVVTVWNQAGLTFTSHTRFHRQVGFDGATVVDFIHELASEAETLADVERLARRRPVASSWGIAVSSWRERRAIVVEVNAARVATVRPGAGDEHLIVANRYRDPGMVDGEVAASPAWARHSDRREARLRELIADARAAGGADVDALVAMLTDRRDPAAPTVERQLGAVVAQACQVHSVVVEPARNRITLGAAAAPVGDGAWLTLDLDWDGTPGAWQVDAPIPAAAGVTVSAGPVRPRAAATDAVARAVTIAQTTHDVDATAAALAEAIAAAPADPSLRLAMTWTALRRRRWAEARDHAAAGLAHETLAYPRGQLLLWGARAAVAADDPVAATRWRRELAALAGAEVAPLRAAAAADVGRPRRHARAAPNANLLLMEAAY
ncbi:MAG: hypothetical protein IPL61_02330 [Myxococcales bacterium]|nr:hypothetical protein [Myxococcales bacterium]